jgi:TMEM175 potassium channel family protein
VSRERTVQAREENEVEFSRIVAFSDGVFAIAITLLVLNLSVPKHIQGSDLNRALWEQRQDLFAYVISFAVIGRFWIVHHGFFSSVVGFDGRLLVLNLFYLGWIALFPFSAEVLGDHGGDTGAIVLYAVNLSGIALVGVLMAADARRAGLARMSSREAREGRRRALTVAAVFLASIPVAFVAPGAAPLLWLALFIDPVGRRVRAHRR